MNNIKLLEYSIKNPEIFLDKYYMFVNKHENLNFYVEQTKKIKNLLITIKELNNKKNSSKILNELYLDLQNLLKKYANYSEFGCFVNACDSNIKEAEQDLDLLKEITNLYIQYRDISDIVPSEWLQALLDKGSSRRKGKSGENKLVDILVEKKFILTKNINEFLKNKSSVAYCNGDFNNKGIEKNFNIKIGEKKQNKKIDLVIKNNNDIYFLEAKHMNTFGGGQDKQNVEYIDLLRNKPNNKNYHFVSFLDGIYFNKLFISKSPKIVNQAKDIKLALKENKNNFFVNTAGFKKLFD